MSFNWITEKTDLVFPANRLDFDEFVIGEDFALSPETLCSLPLRTAPKPLIGMIKRTDDGQLILDEHESALC